MEINKDIIRQAISFYGIDDEDYLNKCYECIDIINGDLKEKYKKIYDILYFGNHNELMQLWSAKNEEVLFGKNYHPYITNIMVLLGYKEHIKNIEKVGLDKEQLIINKKRVRECLYNKNNDGIRKAEMIWASHFITCNIIEVGRLQFEFTTLNPITENEENCIKIHIPRGEKLDLEDVKLSIINSKELVKKYFKLENVSYYCKSWILSKEIIMLLNENSNILKFANMFEITEGNECISDVLKFVFKQDNCNDYNQLSEDTSLQRDLKQLLLEGKKIYLGVGKLKKEILNG